MCYLACSGCLIILPSSIIISYSSIWFLSSHYFSIFLNRLDPVLPFWTILINFCSALSLCRSLMFSLIFFVFQNDVVCFVWYFLYFFFNDSSHIVFISFFSFLICLISVVSFAFVIFYFYSNMSNIFLCSVLIISPVKSTCLSLSLFLYFYHNSLLYFLHCSVLLSLHLFIIFKSFLISVPILMIFRKMIFYSIDIKGKKVYLAC